jgi:hypothetical protein
VAESDCHFVQTAIKRGCYEPDDFNQFFFEISDVPTTFCDEVALELLDNKDLLKIFENCESDRKMSEEIDAINVKRTNHVKRNTPKKHDLGLLKSAEYLRKSGEKCIILTMDGTIREYANENIVRDEVPLAVGLDSLIQLLAIENGGLDHDSTDFTYLFNKIVKSSFAPPKESYQVEDLQFMIQTKIKIEELDNEKKIKIAKKVNYLRLNGHPDEDIILEIQREFQSGIKDLKRDLEIVSAEKSSLKAQNTKISSDYNSIETEFRKTETEKLTRQLRNRITLNWILLIGTPFGGILVGYLLSTAENANILLNYVVSIFTSILASVFMIMFNIKLRILPSDKEIIDDKVENNIQRLKNKN